MIEYGYIDEVRKTFQGSALVASAGIGASVLLVGDAADFTGGSLLLNDVVYPYTAVDYTTNTITLTGTLSATAAEDDPVYTVPSSVTYIATVSIADADDPISARVPFGMTSVLPEGQRETALREVVAVELVNGEWRIKELLGEGTGLVQPDAYDPATIPVPADGIPPATAPTVTISPLGYSGVLIRWTAVSNADAVRYKVYLDTVNPPVQQLTDTAGLLAATSVLSSGTALVPGTTYYAKVVAYDVDGEGPASSVVSSSPVVVPADAVAVDVMVVNELFTRTGYFGTLSADLIVGNQLLAALAVLGGLSVGPGITITPDNGIVIQTPNGETKFPADGSNIVLSADVIATSLTVLGRLAIRGQTNEVSKNATVVLQTGVTPPGAGPSVTATWPQHTAHDGFNVRGFTEFVTASRFLHTESVADGVIVALTENGTTGNFDHAIENWALGADGGRTEVTAALGGVAVIGSHAYVLCQTTEAIPGTYLPEWYIYKCLYNGTSGSTRYSYVSRWKYRPHSDGTATSDVLGGYSQFDPHIGVRGSNLIVAQPRKDTGGVFVTEFTTAGAFVSRDLLTDGAGNFLKTKHCRGVLHSAADIGANRLWLAFAETKKLFAFNDSEARQTADEFDLVTNDPRGVLYDGLFRSRAAALVYDYSGIKDTDLASNPVNVVSTWRKADATSPDFAQYETDVSPRTQTATFPKRAFMTMTTAPIPDDPADANDADSITLYIGRGTNPATSAYKRAATPATGITSATISVIPTATGAPAVQAFPAATPARIYSVASDADGALVDLKGDGSGRVGPYKWSAAGADLNDSGWVTFDSGVGEAPFATAVETYCAYRKVGKRVSIRLAKASTAARDMSANANGNFANINLTAVGAVPTGVRPPASPAVSIVGYGDIDDSPSTFMLNSAGTIIWVGGYPRNYPSGVVATVEFHYWLD